MDRCSFEKEFPVSTCWTDTDQIVRILNKMESLSIPNHMFFPGTGGEDFVRSSLANEHDCISIEDNLNAFYILKPKKLHYETFPDSNWNYFLLELEELNPVLNAANNRCYETLIENILPHCSGERYEPVDNYPEVIPEGYRKVNRYLNGSFLFVMKDGYYNNISATYDGRHGMVNPLEFRDYINGLCNDTEELRKQGLTVDEIKIALNNPKLAKNPF